MTTEIQAAAAEIEQKEKTLMSEEELEKEMKDAISDRSGFYMSSELKRVIAIAKKYRGES